MKLPDEECAKVATSGWIAELDKALFDENLTGPEADTVRTLLGALRHARAQQRVIANKGADIAVKAAELSVQLVEAKFALEDACSIASSRLYSGGRLRDEEVPTLHRIAELRKVVAP
jgi:hypothetical protein